MNKCDHKSDNLFYSVCIVCNKALNGGCFNCFHKFLNDHPIRPSNISVNKWDKGSHLLDNCSKEYFDIIKHKFD